VVIEGTSCDSRPGEAVDTNFYLESHHSTPVIIEFKLHQEDALDKAIQKDANY
jgi:hypothetical protein